MPYLALPDLKYKDSFLAALAEYQAEDQANYRGMNPQELETHFDEYVSQLHQESLGESLPEGFVPHTVFWLVEGDQYLGRVDIRHVLNDFLHREAGHIGYDVRPSERRKGYGSLELKLGKEKARELGMNEVLITCDVTNIGSTKIIEANGGKLENVITVGEGKPDKNRFWITVA